MSATASHSGTFTQGQQSAPLTVNITNNGPGATGDPTGGANPLTVTDTLNSAFAYAGFSGTGWSCSATGQTVVCKNDSAVAQGSSYTALTIDVNVSPTASTTTSIPNQVQVSGGGVTATSSNTDAVTIFPAPQISSVSPNYGAPAALIEISGSNFGATQGDGIVTVGGAPSHVVSWSNIMIAIQVPSKAATGSIVVTANGAASNGEAFTFYPYPAITGISPASGPAGTPVTITGTGLLDGGGNGAVTFNGTPQPFSASRAPVFRSMYPRGRLRERLASMSTATP